MDKIDFEYLARFKDKYPEFKKRGVMIDIGSRNINGSVAWFLDPQVQYIGIDIRNLRSDYIKNYAHIFTSIQNMPYETFSIPDPYVTWCGQFHEYHERSDNSIDLITSFNMFEHDEFWKLTTRRAIELLKPKGRFIFQIITGGQPHGEDYMEREYHNVDKKEFILHLESLNTNIEFVEDATEDRAYIIGTKDYSNG